LPFLTLGSKEDDPDIRFAKGAHYLFKNHELDDSIVQFIGSSADIDGEPAVRGLIFDYINVASISGYNLFYMYCPRVIGSVKKSVIHRKVKCATARELKFISIEGSILICPLRK
ncbi:hypothetical protein ADUPG1_010935, partial [Aduncisulcus paluster]